MTKPIFTPSVPGFDELFKKALAERVEYVFRNKELLLSAWVSQHGWNPDECTLIQQDMQDGSIKMWVEKRGEFEELKRFREREAALQKLLASMERLGIHDVNDYIERGFKAVRDFDLKGSE